MAETLHEPYERFPCNALRRECYRRKLRVVKSGPLANATKNGFVQLLRDDDDDTHANNNNQQHQHQVASSPSPLPLPVRYMPTRKRSALGGDCDGVAAVSGAKKPKSTAALSEGSFYASDSLSSPSPSPSSCSIGPQEWLPHPPTIVPCSAESEASAAASSLIPTRWERLYARLEVVTDKLKQLRGSDPWVIDGNSSDIKFYETMKRQLQQDLLDCVVQT